MAYNSKYTGQEVDNLLDKINNDNVGEIDDALSSTSENPLMNRVVTSELGLKATKDELSGVSNSVTSLSNVVSENKESVDASLESLGDDVSRLDDEKANKSGYYPELHVGLSDNLPDRGDIVEGAIGFRASAGEGNSIEDGVANVQELLGDSVVWNQKVQHVDKIYSGVTSTWAEDYSVTLSGSPTLAYVGVTNPSPVIVNHYYLIECSVIENPNNLSFNFGLFNYVGTVQMPNTTSYNGIIRRCTQSYNSGVGVDNFGGAGVDLTGLKFRARIIDLTQMFGSGNEPSTIEEFYSRCPLGVDMNAYNAGEVIGVNANGFKSVNDNAWDEEWENGYFDIATGEPVSATNLVRSRNFSKVLPNAEYYIHSPNTSQVSLFWYDANKNYIGVSYGTNKVINSPANAAYMMFRLGSDYGTTYNHDICIRLAHSGYKTDYVAHEESEVSFDLSEYFPYGMHGIGEVRDSATPSKATRRIGVKKMKDLAWGRGFSGFYSDGIVSANDGTRISIISNKYTSVVYSPFDSGDKLIRAIYGGEGYAYNGKPNIIDSSYTDVESFTASLTDDDILIYELPEPIETEIDPKQNYNYEVWDFGTEEMLSDVPSMPVITRTIYGFNATDTIRANKTKNEEQDERLTTLEGEVVREGDYSPNNTVGFADDLVGRGESTPSEFSFRATGGKSIKDGTARIKELRGNAVVWNQWCKPFMQADYMPTSEAIDISSLTEDGILVTSWVEYRAIKFNSQLLSKVNHKLLLTFSYNNPTGQRFDVNLGNNRYNFEKTGTENVNIIYNCSATLNEIEVFPIASATDWNLYISNIKLTDLTQMFGSGNEPSTIEEFYSRCPIGVDMNAYNEGEMIADNSTAIKSIGDNAWDEQWELGYLTSTGANAGYVQNYIRAKNYIPVISGEQYYTKVPAYASDEQMFAYDENYNYISLIQPWPNTIITIPPNVRYIRFYMNYGGEVYNNDITISLYHSGWKAEVDNVYKPYVEDTREIDQRILDAFPNGRKPWDKVYNKNGKGYIVKGTGEVDLGSLNWVMSGVYANTFYVLPLIGAALNGDCICAKYTKGSMGVDGEIAILSNGGIAQLYITDSSYTDAATFKTAMQGVTLWYELAEPEIIEYDEPFNLDYEVWDFGTEQAIAEAPSAPINANIIYQFNAVDMIRDHEARIAELEALIATLTSATTTGE